MQPGEFIANLFAGLLLAAVIAGIFLVFGRPLWPERRAQMGHPASGRSDHDRIRARRLLRALPAAPLRSQARAAETAVQFVSWNPIAHPAVDSREGMALAEAAMDSFELIDLLCVVDACASDRSAGRLISMSKAVEELRVLTGDFVSSDEAAANALSQVALQRGCAVLFDEQPGADIMGEL